MSELEKTEMKPTAMAATKSPSTKSRTAIGVGGGLIVVSALLLIRMNAFSTNDVSAASQERLAGVIGFQSVGRGEAIVLLDPAGRVIAGCHVHDCGYRGDKNDAGKSAVFVRSGHRVIGIEVEGSSRRTQNDIEGAARHSTALAVVIGIIGAAILIGGLIL